MILFIQKNGGEVLEVESGTRLIIDLGLSKTLELIVDEQDYKGDTVAFKMATRGKPYARIVTDGNGSSLVVGINDVPKELDE